MLQNDSFRECICIHLIAVFGFKLKITHDFSGPTSCNHFGEIIFLKNLMSRRQLLQAPDEFPREISRNLLRSPDSKGLKHQWTKSINRNSKENSWFENHASSGHNDIFRELANKQLLMVKRFKKNEAKFADALTRISYELQDLKKRVGFVKVDNGYSLFEYMESKKSKEQNDRQKRFDALRLLDTFAFQGTSPVQMAPRYPMTDRSNYKVMLDPQPKAVNFRIQHKSQIQNIQKPVETGVRLRPIIK